MTAQPLIDVERAKKIAENAITHMRNCHIFGLNDPWNAQRDSCVMLSGALADILRILRP